MKFEAVDAKKVDKFFKEEKFDLVLSNRSMLEITNLPKLKSFWSIDEVENSIVVANSVLKFFKSVEKVMTHDAKLITFERLDGLEEILNFIKSMHYNLSTARAFISDHLFPTLFLQLLDQFCRKSMFRKSPKRPVSYTHLISKKLF